MIRDLSFEVTKKDDKGDPIEVKLIAIGDFVDLHRAFKELSCNVLKANEGTK
jgi:hypothetical protein